MGLLSLVLRVGAIETTLHLAAPALVEAHAEKPPARWLIAERVVDVYPGEHTRVRLRVQLTVIEETWAYLPLSPLDAENLAVKLDDRLISPYPGAEALVLLQRLPPGKHQVEATFSVATPAEHLYLPLPEAPRSRLQVHAKGLQIEAEGTLKHTVLTGELQEFLLASAPDLRLTWGPIQPPPPRPTTIRVDQQTALIAEGTGVEGRSFLHIQVANGPIEQLLIQVPGATELHLTGPAGDDTGAPPHHLSGGSGSWTLVFERPLDQGTRLHLRFVAPSPGLAEAPAPVPTFPEAREGAGWLTLLQREELLLVPANPQGLTPAALFERPASAVALADGTALAAYQVSGGSPRLSWQSLGGESMASPALLVDHAEYRLAHATHGGSVLRATYQVRNDREQFLRVRLPPHMRPMGARVAGRHVQLVVVDAETILIPLEKSVETLRGLVAFPVELNLLGEGPAWANRGWRNLQSPAIQAPIANAEWQIAPPPELRVVDLEGTPRSVGPTRALLPYDRGLSKEAPPEEEPSTSSNNRALSQELWNQAYTAYKDNRFGEADNLLRRSLETDASNSAALALQDNVDLLLGRTSYGAEDKEKAKVARKVKAMASAKADSTRALQSSVQAEAEEAERSGDTDRAREAYRQLVEVTETLANLEQDEQVDQKLSLQRWSQKLGEIEQRSDEVQASSAKPNEAPIIETRASSLASSLTSNQPANQRSTRNAAPDANISPNSPEVEFEGEPLSEDDDGEEKAGKRDRLEDLPTAESAPPALVKEALARIPTGRAYQSTIEVLVGSEKSEEADRYTLEEEDARRLPVARDVQGATRLAGSGRTLTAGGDNAVRPEKKQESRREAAQVDPDRTIVYKSATEIDFEGLQVSEQPHRPNGAATGEAPSPAAPPAAQFAGQEIAGAIVRPDSGRIDAVVQFLPTQDPGPQTMDDLKPREAADEDDYSKALSELGYLGPEPSPQPSSGEVVDTGGGYAGHMQGGVEGGVVGGVVGGVLGGVMGGVAVPPPAPEPKTPRQFPADRPGAQESDKNDADYEDEPQMAQARVETKRGEALGGKRRPNPVQSPAFPQRPRTQTPPPVRSPQGPEHPSRPNTIVPAPLNQPAESFPQAAPDATPPPLRSPPLPLPFRAYQPPPPPPRRAPVAPPEWPLPIPTGIDAATLTLSMPQPANPLLLRQQLVPSDEPLQIRLRTRPSKRPNKD